MRICSSCGKQIRDEADFCTSCGAPAPAKEYKEESTVPPSGEYAAGESPEQGNPQSVAITVPLITLAPQHASFTRKRMLRMGKLAMIVSLVLVLTIAAVFVVAYLQTDPFKESSFDSVDTSSYRDCLALVADVRNENFDAILDDLVSMSGAADDYNFLNEYERIFRDIIPDDSDQSAVMFRNCCYMISYAEFRARLTKAKSERFLGFFYIEDADNYRLQADHLWEQINSAQTDEELQAIIDYCEKNEIISLKDNKTE